MDTTDTTGRGTASAADPSHTADTADTAGPAGPAGPVGPAASGPGWTAPPVATELRVGTVVWGLVLAVVGAGLLALAAGYTFDLELAVIGLVALAGLGLLVGAAVNGRRRR